MQIKGLITRSIKVLLPNVIGINQLISSGGLKNFVWIQGGKFVYCYRF